MSDKLKHFIDGHRPDFDDQEVPEGIWNDIKLTLPQTKQRSLWNSVAVWRSAAALLLGLSVYLIVVQSGFMRRRDLAQTQGDFADLESFYSSQIAEKVALIDDFETAGESDQFSQDFQKLEAMYQVLREELKNHPGKKLKDALVLNLLVRVDLLNQQLKKLEDAKKRGRKYDQRDTKPESRLRPS